MYKNYFFLLLVLTAISCKKNDNLSLRVQPDEAKLSTNENSTRAIDSVALSKRNDSLLYAFYQKNKFQTFWVNSPCRENLLHLFQNAENDGINPNDFDLKKLLKTEKSVQSLSQKEGTAYDILLTTNLIRFVKKIAVGSLDPTELYTDWDLKKNNTDIQALVLAFQKKDSFDYAVYQLKPRHWVYKSLEEALRLLNNFPNETNWQPIDAVQKITVNDSSSNLIAIKKRLQYWNDLKTTDSLTNHYDETTLQAVKKFQMRHGLAPDGVIGKGTIAALNFSKEKRKAQLVANMERWRWYPREFEPNYLMVNIPDYSLWAVSNKQMMRAHKVIVGTSKRSTPILSSRLNYIVLNPTWTVPPTILKEDVIPAARKNRAYFSQKNIVVYDAKGQVVPAENWNASQARSYRYVQNPGATNSLGLVKIMFPNRFSVYLHDTNTRGYFERNNRSISSGCVRVQNPFELCEYLLDDPKKWSLQQLNEIINSGKTKNVHINNKIGIHLLYWTAWSENDQLHFRDDIYGLDAELYQKLRK